MGPGCQKGNSCPLYHDKSKAFTSVSNASKMMGIAAANRQTKSLGSRAPVVPVAAPKGQFIDFETGQTQADLMKKKKETQAIHTMMGATAAGQVAATASSSVLKQSEVEQIGKRVNAATVETHPKGAE